MRRACCVLVGLAILGGAPVAQAQFTPPIPQDLSIAGELVGREGANVRTVRLTVTNHGPGAVDGISMQVTAMARDAVVRSAPPGCAEVATGHQCDLGTHLEQGETRSLDIVFEYVTTSGPWNTAIAYLTLSRNGFGTPDASFANNQATVDLDREYGPPALDVLLVGADGGYHGASTLSQVVIRNAGGTRLSGIRVSSDRCPEDAQRNETGQTTLETNTSLSVSCRWKIPPHVKADRRITETVTVTANAPGDRTVTATDTGVIYLAERRRSCGSFRARGRTYGVKTTAADFTCAATRRFLKRCLTGRKRPKGFRCQVSGKGAGVVVWKPKRLPNDRMIALARR
jgi:hypothetical protein